MADEPQGPDADEVEDSPETESGSEQDTAANEATASTDATPDWEQRFKDTQAAYTQSQQFLSALQGNLGPQVQQQAFAQLGYEIPEETDEDDAYIDEDEQLRQEVAQLREAFMAQQEAQQAEVAEAQEVEWLAESIDALERKDGTQLSAEEVELVASNALANRLDNGAPNIEGAYQALRAAQSAYQKRYIESKRAPQVTVGGAGDEKIDTSDDNARQDAMRRLMEAQLAE